MENHIVPERLKHIEENIILNELSSLYEKRKPNLKVKDPKSVFGKVIKVILGSDSTLEERFYVQHIWNQSNKVNYFKHYKITQY